jgi:hypothetical protein
LPFVPPHHNHGPTSAISTPAQSVWIGKYGSAATMYGVSIWRSPSIRQNDSPDRLHIGSRRRNQVAADAIADQFHRHFATWTSFSCDLRDEFRRNRAQLAFLCNVFGRPISSNIHLRSVDDWGALSFKLAGSTITSPGFLVIAAVVYALLASGTMVLMGRRFVTVSETKNQAERNTVTFSLVCGKMPKVCPYGRSRRGAPNR